MSAIQARDDAGSDKDASGRGVRQTKIGFWMQFENGAYCITEKLHIEYKEGARMSPCIFMLSARPELPFTEKRKMKVRTTGAVLWIHHF